MSNSSREVSFVIRATDAASAAFNSAQKAAGDVATKFVSLKGIVENLTQVFGLFSLGVVTRDLIELGVASDRTFHQLAAILPTATAGIADLRAGLDDLAVHSGRSLTDIESLAMQIAQLGVGSAGELQQIA